MKTAITVTRRGVITLPAKLRAAAGIRADDQVIAEVTAQGLLLRPAVILPVEIYTPQREAEFDAAEADLAAAMALRGAQLSGQPTPSDRRSPATQSSRRPTATKLTPEQAKEPPKANRRQKTAR